METNQHLLENDLIIDSAGHNHIKETAMWAKFLAITGFIMSGLIAILAVFAASMFSRLSGYSVSGSSRAMAGGTIMIVYLLIAAVVFFMSMYLFRFAKKAQEALKSTDQESLTTAFQNLKVYFRFAGIISIVGLIFSVLGVIGIIMASAFSRY